MMTKFRLSLVFSMVCTFSTNILFAQTTLYHPNNLFIKMKPGHELPKSALIKSSKNIFGNIYLVKASNADELATNLAATTGIEYIKKDYYAPKKDKPKHEVLNEGGLLFKRLQNFDFNSTDTNLFNDPHVSKLWAFNQSAGLNVIEAYRGLQGQSLAEVIVAVVDTGVDHNHEDLKDVMWINRNEIPGNKKDDDKNGHIDDIHGINTLVRDSRGKPTMNTMASHWHGTHVAGTIAATQNNGTGIAGVASNVKIMAIRTVPDDADELDSNIVEAFLYAAKMGAKIINCSFGKELNEEGMVVRDTINEISKKGVLVVISAGNDSTGPLKWRDIDVELKYPASFDSDNTLVIASTTNTESLSNFSNIGAANVDVASPGSNIYSTLNGNKYGFASGTSMAAPNATGVAAMVLGMNPQLSAKMLKKILINSVTKVPNLKGKMVSGGRINLKSALNLAGKNNL